MTKLIDIADKAMKEIKTDFGFTAEEWISLGMPIENYHKHTHFSNLIQPDSATSEVAFAKRSQECGCKYYFSGEHGYAGEWAHIYNFCKEIPLKFRYSVEAYWVKDLHEQDNTNCHIIIIARNYNAVRKLNYIITMSHQEGFYYKPRIDLDLLFTLDKEEVFVTSACVAGWKYEDAEEIWLKIWEHFGDSFFLEYQANHTDKQFSHSVQLKKMAQQYGINTIAGLDTHYIDEEDRIKRDSLLERKGISYPDEEGWFMDFPTGEELYKRFKEQGALDDEDIIKSMLNTHYVANECEDFEISTGFKIPILNKYKDMSYEERANEFKSLLNEKFKTSPKDELRNDRIEGVRYEYGEIKDSGTVDYFLTNYNIIHTALTPEYGGELTKTSRGSASSYYTCNLLGFTTMDRFTAEVPIIPQRFLTKDRILSSHQMPDIDFNISDQEPFVKASRDLIGEHGCYQLLAIGKLGEKSGFKLYADIAGLEPSVANEISACITRYNEAVKQADDDDKDSIMIEDYITDEEHLRIFKESKPYQGIIEQGKAHACGFMLFNGDVNNKDVIGYGDIRYEFGLIRCHSESGKKDTIVVNIEGGLLDKLGYVKNDYLIVDVVSITNKLYHSLGMEVPSVDELKRMVDGDDLVWDLYANGITCCLNQCEKPGTTNRAMKYKPKNVKELSAFIAGIRPGFKSLIDGFLNRIDYTSGEKAIDDILDGSFHYMLYQEAVMKIFTYLGIEMKESYDTIKKISKKKLVGEQLAHVESVLKSHWLENIGNLDNFDSVYTIIKDSARYSFCAPHSLAYACDSLYEAWVKGHHPSVFYEVALNHYQLKNDKNKINDLLKEATTKMGYTIGDFIYGADNSKFTVDDENKVIYPSLPSVKGFSAKAVEDIYELSKLNPETFLDLIKLTEGTKVTSKFLENLIYIGYFRDFGTMESLLFALRMYDKFSKRNTLSVKEAEEKDFCNIDMNKYGNRILKSGGLGKVYRDLDWFGLIKEVYSLHAEEELGILTIAKAQMDILGYISYLPNEVDDWRYVYVSDIDDRYGIKFECYSLLKRNNATFKVTKKQFSNKSFAPGSIIYINKCSKKSARKYVDGEYVVLDGVFNWWIDDYTVAYC